MTGTKSDRLQTSTCSVAFLPQPRELKIVVPEAELKYEYMKSSGAGGQSVNTTDSACRLIHMPTGNVSVILFSDRESRLTRFSAYDSVTSI